MKENKQRFRIYLALEVEEQIRWLTENYDKEISAWLCGSLQDGDFYVDDILYPKQEVSGSDIDTDESALVELRKEYGELCNSIIGHWHSHNDMSSFWSSTDEDFIDLHMNGSRPVRLFLVSSIEDGIKARVELRDPINITIDDLLVEREYTTKDMRKKMEGIINDKVTEKEYVYRSPTSVIEQDLEDWTDEDEKYWLEKEKNYNSFDRVNGHLGRDGYGRYY